MPEPALGNNLGEISPELREDSPSQRAPETTLTVDEQKPGTNPESAFSNPTQPETAIGPKEVVEIPTPDAQQEQVRIAEITQKLEQAQAREPTQEKNIAQTFEERARLVSQLQSKNVQKGEPIDIGPRNNEAGNDLVLFEEIRAKKLAEHLGIGLRGPNNQVIPAVPEIAQTSQVKNFEGKDLPKAA